MTASKKCQARWLPIFFNFLILGVSWLQSVFLLEYQAGKRHNPCAVTVLPSSYFQSAGLLLMSQLYCYLGASSTFLSCYQFCCCHICHWLPTHAILPTFALVFLVVLSHKYISVHIVISICTFLLQILAGPLPQESALTERLTKLSVFLSRQMLSSPVHQLPLQCEVEHHCQQGL